MSDCVYCGKPAGFLKKKHDECERQHIVKQKMLEKGREDIVSMVTATITGADSFDELEKKISAIEHVTIVPVDERKSHFVKGWEAAVDRFLEDGILNKNEEERLLGFQSQFSLSQNELDKNGAYSKIVKAAILRDVMDGKIPERLQVVGNFSINFQKGEQIVWAFNESKYLEDRERRHYEGGSRGVNVRIMKGVYYRVGSFKGHAVTHTERVLLDTGWTVITNKNIYFAGSRKAVRIPYNKILTFEPFDDGIGILKDTATAKLQVFVTGDGWFTYNLTTNLARI